MIKLGCDLAVGNGGSKSCGGDDEAKVVGHGLIFAEVKEKRPGPPEESPGKAPSGAPAKGLRPVWP